MFKDIDDAINVMKRKYDRIEKLNGSTGEYHSEYDKQVIDWLEELKELRAKISELYDERQAENAFMKEHDKQIRADAFEECIKFIKDHSSRAFIDSDGWGCTDNDREDIFKLFWLDDLEQLKEQNNE